MKKKLSGILFFPLLFGCAEAPFVFYQYSGTVRNASSDPISGVSVKVTDPSDTSTAIGVNHDGVIPSSTTDINGNYLVKVGYRGNWSLKLVFSKSGYAEQTVDIASINESHNENDVVTAVVDTTLE